jgi:hypothetical protein
VYVLNIYSNNSIYFKKFKAWIYPMVKDMYIDTLSLRKKIPASFDGNKMQL